MDPALAQQLRASPLFANLSDEQMSCLERGEVITAQPGTLLAKEGERTGYFLVNLEGEVRVTRTYDRQEVLMGVNRPGLHMGEIPLLLDTPWPATARVSKPSKFLRLDEADAAVLGIINRINLADAPRLAHVGAAGQHASIEEYLDAPQPQHVVVLVQRARRRCANRLSRSLHLAPAMAAILSSTIRRARHVQQ